MHFNFRDHSWLFRLSAEKTGRCVERLFWHSGLCRCREGTVVEVVVSGNSMVLMRSLLGKNLHINLCVLNDSIITLLIQNVKPLRRAKQCTSLCYRCLSLSVTPKLTVTLQNVSIVACLELRSALINQMSFTAFHFIKKIHCWCKSRDNSTLFRPRVLLKTDQNCCGEESSLHLVTWSLQIKPSGSEEENELA